MAKTGQSHSPVTLPNKEDLGYNLSVLKTISMLGEDALAMLTATAKQTRGTILEVGAYVGGSTVAIAKGMPEGAKFLTVEAGGAHLHDELPSLDIVADLRANLKRFDVDQKVTVVAGSLYDAFIYKRLLDAIGEGSVGFLSMDADGRIAAGMYLVAPLLRVDCLLCFDDYSSLSNEEKDRVKINLVADFVDSQVEAGNLEEFGVFGWGTWFGRINGPESLKNITANVAGFAAARGETTPAKDIKRLEVQQSELTAERQKALVANEAGASLAATLQQRLTDLKIFHEEAIVSLRAEAAEGQAQAAMERNLRLSLDEDLRRQLAEANQRYETSTSLIEAEAREARAQAENEHNIRLQLDADLRQQLSDAQQFAESLRQELASAKDLEDSLKRELSDARAVESSLPQQLSDAQNKR